MNNSCKAKTVYRRIVRITLKHYIIKNAACQAIWEKLCNFTIMLFLFVHIVSYKSVAGSWCQMYRSASMISTHPNRKSTYFQQPWKCWKLMLIFLKKLFFAVLIISFQQTFIPSTAIIPTVFQYRQCWFNIVFNNMSIYVWKQSLFSIPSTNKSTCNKCWFMV